MPQKPGPTYEALVQLLHAHEGSRGAQATLDALETFEPEKRHALLLDHLRGLCTDKILEPQLKGLFPADRERRLAEIAKAQLLRDVLDRKVDPAAAQAATPPAKVLAPSKSIKWFDSLFEHPGLTVYDVAVGSYLFRRAGRSMECWPRQGEIARACHIRRETVNASVARLVSLRMVESKQRRRHGSGKVTSMSNKYVLFPPEEWEGMLPQATLLRERAECVGEVSGVP